MFYSSAQGVECVSDFLLIDGRTKGYSLFFQKHINKPFSLLLLLAIKYLYPAITYFISFWYHLQPFRPHPPPMLGMTMSPSDAHPIYLRWMAVDVVFPLLTRYQQ